MHICIILDSFRLFSVLIDTAPDLKFTNSHFFGQNQQFSVNYLLYEIPQCGNICKQVY